MKYTELFEATDPFANNPYIVDLRIPGWKDHYEPYTEEHMEYMKKYDMEPDPKGRLVKAEQTMMAIGNDGKLYLFYYGHDGNTMNWRELNDYIDKRTDRNYQDRIAEIVVDGKNILIDRSRSGMKGWDGDRNKYSDDVKAIADIFLDRGIPGYVILWLGNWAAGFKGAEKLGTINQILKRSDVPNKIVLYHGTSTYRMNFIEKEGLKPLEIEDRVWNKGGSVKERPAHRDDCVYLTASRPQAEYYAKKATNTDRARFNISKRYDAGREIARLESGIRNMKEMAFQKQIASDELQDYMTKAEKRIADLKKKYQTHYDKFEPVLLEITLTKAQYKNLMADDDHLERNKNADPNDWLSSLSGFGQVAYRGSIPISQIKVIATGKNAERNSR